MVMGGCRKKVVQKPSRIIEPVQRKAVQSFNDNIKLLEGLSDRAILILEMLGAGNSEAYCSKHVPCSKGLVTHWKDRLIKIDALRLKCKDVTNYFELTPYGSKILTGSDTKSLEAVLLEDHAVKFRVLQRETSTVCWAKLGDVKNWDKMGAKVEGVRVILNDRLGPDHDRANVIIHPGKLKGFDPDTLEVEAGRIIERVKTILEGKFGMLLSEDGVCIHKPIFRFYSEEAKELVKFGTTNVDGVGSIDNSPPEHIPHEEYIGKDLAKERLLMPKSIKALEVKLAEMDKKFDLFLKNQSDILDKLTADVGSLSTVKPPVRGLYE
jgi:hypothetical protein